MMTEFGNFMISVILFLIFLMQVALKNMEVQGMSDLHKKLAEYSSVLVFL